jgi:hypothetical protein
MLLLHPNKPVSSALLSEAIWDGEPPATARTSLQNHIMLRRALGGDVGPRLVTRAPGYLIEARDDELDLRASDRLSDSGRGAARRGARHEAAYSLRAALRLWTGEPIANVRARGPLAAAHPLGAEARRARLAARLDDLRLPGTTRAPAIGHPAGQGHSGTTRPPSNAASRPSGSPG